MIPSISKKKATKDAHHTGNRTTRGMGGGRAPKCTLITSQIERYAKTNAFVLKGRVITPDAGRTGRPSVITQEVVTKLEHAFVYDATVEEACIDAGISRNTYYEFLKRYPDFQDRIDQLRHATSFVLRKCLIIAAERNADLALKYLERKRPMEFSTRSQIHHTGEVSDRHSIDPEQAALIRRAMGNWAIKMDEDEARANSVPAETVSG